MKITKISTLFLLTIKSIVIFITIKTTAQNLILDDFNEKVSKIGMSIDFNYAGEVHSNLSGGMEKKSVYLDNFDLVFKIDLQKILGLEGANVNTYFLGNHGGIPSEYVGADQGISNIAAHDTWKLYEFWLEQSLFDNKLSLLAGLYDLNSEFDTRETSGIFINPSHGIGAEFALTGENGPSIFPTTSLALRAQYNFSNSVNFKAAIFDGIPGDPNNPNGTKIVLDSDEDLLLASELTFKSETQEFDKNYFKINVGGWYYTNEFESLLETDNSGNPLMKKGNYGVYVSAEKFLFAESRFDNQGLAAFVRGGLADNKINQVDNYFGAGINYVGLFPGRDEDILGFAIAAAHNCNDFRIASKIEDPSHNAKDFEYIFELTYNITLLNYLQIQPDLQYVVDPGGCNHNTHSLVFGTRIKLAL